MIPSGVLWDFICVADEYYKIRKRIGELREAFREKRSMKELDAQLTLCEERLKTLGDRIKHFSKKHFNRAFTEWKNEFESTFDRGLNENSLDRSEDLRAIFLLGDAWKCFQKLKQELKEPNMTDDRAMRELFNMAGKSV